MVIRSNQYNDPALGEAFNNIASIFAPPGAQDLVGYATAKAKKEDAERRAYVFNNPNDPLSDRLATLAGLYTPTQSYYAQDQNNATTQRGQDVSARTSIANNLTNDATNRRGQDITANTMLTTNAADNTRALATNAADNTRALTANTADNATTQRGQDITANTTLATNAADNSRSLAQTLYGMTLAPGEISVPVPSSVADMYNVEARGSIAGAPKPLSETELRAQILSGLPSQDRRATVMGDVPIEAVRQADGSVVNMFRTDAVGRQPVIGETEQKALERQALIEKGLFTDQMLLDDIFGAQGLEKVVDPSGNVTFATRRSAIGKTPFIDAGNAPAKEIYSYVTPDGQQGSATFDPSSGVLLDVATGAVLPQGTKTMKLQGEDATAMAGTPSNVTLGQRTVAEADYAKTRLDSYRKLLQDNPGAAGVPGMIRGFAQDVVSGIGEMTAEYGTSANIPIEEVRALAERVTQGERDPAIRAAQSYAIEMAYAQAKLGDPGGEVNVREFERLLDVYDGGIAGNDAVLESLAVFEEQINQRLAYGQALQAGGGAAAVPAPGAAVAATPPAAGGGAVLIFDEKGEQVQ